MILSRRIALNSIALIVASYFVVRISWIFSAFPYRWCRLAADWCWLNGLGDAKAEGRGYTKAGVHRNVDTNDLFQKAFYPLTLPLTVGPGSISVAITLGANDPTTSTPSLFHAWRGDRSSADRGQRFSLLCVCRPVGGNPGSHFHGVIMRLSSFLLVCIGTQIIWNGLSTMLKSLSITGHPG